MEDEAPTPGTAEPNSGMKFGGALNRVMPFDKLKMANDDFEE